MFDRPRWYVPNAREERALTCLAELWHSHDRLEEGVFPGWNPRTQPLALFQRDGSFFLAGHPIRPAEAEEVFLAAGVDGLPVYRLRGLPDPVTGGAVTLPFLGIPTGFVPLERAGEGVEEAVEFTAFLAHESFHAFQLRWAKVPLPLPSVPYPDDHPVNNALGNIEGHLLLEAARAPEEEVPNLALAFALIRRERRAHLDDDQILHERVYEVYEGLSTYVSVRLLERLAAPDHRPSPAFARLTGDGFAEAARAAANRRLEALRTINARGLGAGRRRFHYSGLGLALLLDRFRPGWKDEIDGVGVWMDTLVEEAVEFDGGERDDRVIARVEHEYDYVAKLREERDHARAVRRRKQELISDVLRGAGTVVIFDVSDLQLTESHLDPERLEPIGDRLQIHTGRAHFRYGRTTLTFDGLPVIEDRYNGLFEVRLPEGRLRVRGDQSDIRVLKPARFTEGLDLRVGGVRVSARQGVIHPVGDAVYIKIFR